MPCLSSALRCQYPIFHPNFITLSPNKIQNADILVPAYPGCYRKWPMNECLVVVLDNFYCFWFVQVHVSESTPGRVRCRKLNLRGIVDSKLEQNYEWSLPYPLPVCLTHGVRNSETRKANRPTEFISDKKQVHIESIRTAAATTTT